MHISIWIAMLSFGNDSVGEVSKDLYLNIRYTRYVGNFRKTFPSNVFLGMAFVTSNRFMSMILIWNFSGVLFSLPMTIIRQYCDSKTTNNKFGITSIRSY